MLETLASHCSIARTIQGCAIHHGGSLFDVTIHTRDHRAGWSRSVLNRFTSIDCSSSSWKGMLEEPTLRVQSSTIEKELKITGGPNQAEVALRYTLKDFLCARYQRRLFLISPHNREITIFFFFLPTRLQPRLRIPTTHSQNHWTRMGKRYGNPPGTKTGEHRLVDAREFLIRP